MWPKMNSMLTVSFFPESLGVPQPKKDTKTIGDRSEAQVLATLIDAGYHVAIPFGENHRYDFIVEDPNGRLLRIQVKTGRLKNGAIRFNGFSSHSHRGGLHARRYCGEIDFFAVYCFENQTVYFVPEEQAAVRPLLRIARPRNNMKKTIVWAERFALPPHEQKCDELKAVRRPLTLDSRRTR
jgi:hypothetical protein